MGRPRGSGCLNAEGAAASAAGVGCWAAGSVVKAQGLLGMSARNADRTPQVRRHLLVQRSRRLVDLARRLVARPEASRFDPVVVVDDTGRAVGVVRAERVVARLTALADGRRIR